MIGSRPQDKGQRWGECLMCPGPEPLSSSPPSAAVARGGGRECLTRLPQSEGRDIFVLWQSPLWSGWWEAPLALLWPEGKDSHKETQQEGGEFILSPHSTSPQLEGPRPPERLHAWSKAGHTDAPHLSLGTHTSHAPEALGLAWHAPLTCLVQRTRHVALRIPKEGDCSLALGPGRHRERISLGS